MAKYIVVFRQHGELIMNTDHIGPFEEWSDAYEYLAYLPALGTCPEGENPGVKFVQELLTGREHEVLMMNRKRNSSCY